MSGLPHAAQPPLPRALSRNAGRGLKPCEAGLCDVHVLLNAWHGFPDKFE